MTHDEETKNFLGDPINDEPYEDWDDGSEPGYCYRCDDSGWIMTCLDDLCRGSGECIHGDGEMICPVCGGRNAF